MQAWRREVPSVEAVIPPSERLVGRAGGGAESLEKKAERL